MAFYDAYLVANLTLLAILVLPVLVIWILFIFQVRRRQDPARNGIIWVKVAYPLFLLSIMASIANDCTFFFDGVYIYEAANYLALVSEFLEQLSDIFALVAIIELGLGFLFIQRTQRETMVNTNASANANSSITNKDGSSPFNPVNPVSAETQRRYEKTLRMAVAFFNVVLCSLAAAALGMACNGYMFYYHYIATDGYTDDSSVNTTAIAIAIDYVTSYTHTSNELGAAFDILQWVLSLPLIGFAAYVHHGRVKDQDSGRDTTLLLVATVLWFVRFMWHLFYNAKWVIQSGNWDTVPNWFNAVDPILNTWAYFVVLVLLYVIGERKARGLWSTARSWLHPTALAAASYYQPAYNPWYSAPGVQPPLPPLPPPPPSMLPQQPQQQPATPYQLPRNNGQPFQTQIFHEMAGAEIVPLYPQQQVQEMYAPQPGAQLSQEAQQVPSQHAAQSSLVSPLVTSAGGFQTTPPPVSTIASTPVRELKS